MSKYCVFIISHGRPDNIKTISTLRSREYSGKIFIVIDDLDKTRDRYIEEFGEEMIIVFDKQEMADKTDQGDNFNNLRTTTHARNACFDIAERLNYKYFIVLDDDYINFRFRFDDKLNYKPKPKDLKSVDKLFSYMMEFYINNKQISSICLSQGGDFIGGKNSWFAEKIRAKRKVMNSFFCSTERPFNFISRLNEDVNTYLYLNNKGKIFLTLNQVCLEQTQTQSSSGGMTEAYRDYGTYVKSLYSVMYHPSAVTVREIGGSSSRRLHHNITWKKTAPKILRESLRKES